MNKLIFFLYPLLYRSGTAKRILGHYCLKTVSGLFLCALAVQAQAGSLTNVRSSTLPGNNVEVVMEFSEDAATPQTFVMDNPARIVLDFPQTQLQWGQRSLDVQTGPVRTVNVAEASERVRVVVDLVYAGPYSIQQEGQHLVLFIGSSADSGTNTQVAYNNTNKSMSAVSAAPPVPRAASIDGVDFRRSEHGAAQVVVTLSDPSTIIDMKQVSGNIVLEFRDATLPERLDRRLDVTDFATPVVSVDTTAQGDDVHMEITIAGSEYEHLAYQTDNTYIVEIKQVVPEPEDDKEIAIQDKNYKGELLSLDFQSIDVLSALYLLADFRNANVVADKNKVEGKLTLKLKNVPWDQARDIILDNRGLGIREIGNVWSIEPKKDIDERRKRELEAKKEIKELEPLRTEFIQINYSKAGDLKQLLAKTDGGGKDADSQSFLSSRGSVSVDERTNTLLVQDTADKLAEIRKLVAALDQPVRQVLISSRVVIANNDFGKDLGIKFGNSTNFTVGDNGWGAVTGGKLPGDTSFGEAGVAFNDGSNENFILDLPANPAIGTAAAFGLAVGKIGTYLLQLELSALESEGRGEIVSSPRVVTANQKEATIKQGVEVPVQGVAGANAAAAPTFKEAVLELKVTPQITPDDRVIMDLAVKKDDVQSSGNFGKREVTTQVLVNNGETVVLGGVYEQTKSNTVERVPFFGELPLVGVLFRRSRDVESKQELLIFITPKILQDSVS